MFLQIVIEPITNAVTSSLTTPKNFIPQTVRISGSADYQIYINFLNNLALSLI